MGGPLRWSQEELQGGELRNKSNKPIDKYKAYCYGDHWSQHAGAEVSAEVKKPRSGTSCFYLKRISGMSYEGGWSLYKSEQENIRLKRDYRYTQYGLWLAAIGILVGAISQVASCVGS